MDRFQKLFKKALELQLKLETLEKEYSTIRDILEADSDPVRKESAKFHAGAVSAVRHINELLETIINQTVEAEAD